MADQLQCAAEHAVQGSSGLVPVGYAEKSMASLMQLHSELMDEKERRVDLYRRLMDKEQALAELKMYVGLLEEKIAKQGEQARGAKSSSARVPPPNAPRVAPAQPRPPPPPRPIARERPRISLRSSGPPGRTGSLASDGAVDVRGPPSSATERSSVEGWRTW